MKRIEKDLFKRQLLELAYNDPDHVRLPESLGGHLEWVTEDDQRTCRACQQNGHKHQVRTLFLQRYAVQLCFEQNLMFWGSYHNWSIFGLTPDCSKRIGKPLDLPVICEGEAKHLDGGTFVYCPRDTAGLKGSQDPYYLLVVDDSGIVTHDFGTCPSLHMGYSKPGHPSTNQGGPRRRKTFISAEITATGETLDLSRGQL